MWEFHSSFDVHGHFSLIVMCCMLLSISVQGILSVYLSVFIYLSTLVMAVVLHSSCDLRWGGHPVVVVICSLLAMPECQLSSCVYSTLVLVVGLHSRCDVLGWSYLVVLFRGLSF